jgi:hypothetical protein
LNPLFLEDEVATLGFETFQAGLRLEVPVGRVDDMGLRDAKTDLNAADVNEIVTTSNVLKFRQLINEYSKNPALRLRNQIRAKALREN